MSEPIDWAALKSMTEAGLSSDDIRALGGGDGDDHDHGGGGGTATRATGNLVEDTVDEYPQLAGIIDHPDLGPILQEAAENGWDADKLFAAVFETDFYQKQFSNQRQLSILKKTDPAEYARRWDGAEAQMSTLMSELGIPPKDRPWILKHMTTTYLNHGGDDWVVFDQLKKLMRKDPNIIGSGGSLAAKQQSYQEIAHDYLVSMSDEVAKRHAVNIWSREDSEEAFENRIRQQAIKRFATLEDELKRGLTVRQALDPQLQAVAQMLEMDANDIDLNHGRWSHIWDYRDPETGKARTMTITEAQRYARQQEEWQNTDNARDEAAKLSLRLVESMGKI